MGRSFVARGAGLALLFGLAAGCGRNEVVPDASVQPDASSPVDAGTTEADADLSVLCPSPEDGEVGGNCGGHADCDPEGDEEREGDGICLDGSLAVNGPDEGFCVLAGCDEAGNECAEGSICVNVAEPGESGFHVCLPACCDDSLCPIGQLCQDRYFSVALGADVCLPGSAAAADGDPCDSIADCNAGSFCRSDPFVFPGGFCQGVGCTVGDSSTCAGGGRCIDLDGVGGRPPICVLDCDGDADCRDDEGYFCRDLSSFGFGKFCDHREVGEPCENDADCGAGDWVCLDLQDGYCTVDECDLEDASTCPIRSHCFDPIEGDTFCVADCDPDDPDACRTGYACAQVVDGENPRYGCVPPIGPPGP